MGFGITRVIAIGTKGISADFDKDENGTNQLLFRL